MILITGIVGGLILFSGISAQTTGVTISPLTFELTANPGDVFSNKLKVYNQTDSTMAIKMEIEDFTVTGEKGEVIIEPAGTETYSLAQWITTEPETFTLTPKEQKIVDFTINVPVNAEPGGHYGSVLASTVGAITEGTPGVGVAQKVGALILLTVSGEIEEELIVKEFSALSFSEYGPVSFTIKFENTGTVHLRPRGFVTITNWWGKKVADIEFPQLNVIPGAVRRIEASWENKWLFGKYTATLVGGYGTINTPLEPSVFNFWVIPWKIVSGVFVALFLIIFYFYKTRKRWKAAIKILLRGEKV